MHMMVGSESVFVLTLAGRVQPPSRPWCYALARPHMLLHGNTLRRAPARDVEGFALVDLRADLVGTPALPAPRAHTLELVDALNTRAKPTTLHIRAFVDI